MPKSICLGALKGGVGKTNLAFNIAGVLAEQGYKVLAIDNDLQGNLTNNCNISREHKGLAFVYDPEIDTEKIQFEQIVCKNPIKELKNLDVIPSSILLHKIEQRMDSVPMKEHMLKYFLEDNEEKINYYDYILIDTNPSLSPLNQNAFLASQSIVLVTDMDENSLEGVELFIGLWADLRRMLRLKDNVKGIIVNIVDQRESTVTENFINFIEEREGLTDLIFSNYIPRDVKMKKTAQYKIPLNLVDKKCKAYLSLQELIKEMKERGIL